MEYKHFSHHHNLKIHPVRALDRTRCSGCESLISGSAYGCLDCSYFLHERCGNAARSMQHRSHPFHHLTLVPYTTYSAGSFVCKACGKPGKAFSFCCPLCDFDLHVQCALLPELVTHQAHPHNLALAHGAVPGFFQFGSSSQSVCSICRQILDNNIWSYNCYLCNYRMHAACAFREIGRPEDTFVSNVTAEPVSDDGKDTTPRQQCDAHKDKNVSAASQSSGTTTEPLDTRDSGTRQNSVNSVDPRVMTANPATGISQNQPGQTQVEDPILRQQLELQQLQLQLEMNAQLASMMASFNLSSFV